MTNGQVLVETVQTTAGPAPRELPDTGPAVETYNARVIPVGPFRQDNPPASQAATAMTYGAADAVAPTSQIAFMDGDIIGVADRSNADLTAGTATAQATINGTAVGLTAVLSDLVQQKVTLFLTPVPFVAGDLLGVKLATNAAYAPVTADHSAQLLIRWKA